ncbi:hypothetical protein DBB34_05900 [Sphaerisporangium cinnabarinum]|nr:hypothetical protein [Sphaerisporangium cinnabarinum]PTU57114.1 hypothetical protein DBB34_05900 [Sphaerisporangium cinnabarinum]
MDAFGDPCRTAPTYLGVMVGLLAAPLLLGLATARLRRARVWIAAILGAALVLYVVLLIVT